MKTLLHAIVMFTVFGPALLCRADESQPTRNVAPLRVLKWIEVGAKVKVEQSESAPGYVLIVYSNEQAAQFINFTPDIVTEVAAEYIVIRSAKPANTTFGLLHVEKTIPLHAIAAVTRYVAPEESQKGTNP